LEVALRTQYVAHSFLATSKELVDRIIVLENIPASDKAEDVATFQPEAM
jgi:hypothetical protein